ncbi:MAG: ABC transporter ATP-binding protein [Myxococcales bacterium FL481]|nr:MAG: ABC transporter ATP-binding protein [Myxococcales bacterium FL481]
MRSPSSPSPLIRLRGLYKIYGTGTAEVRALDGVDLDIHEGQFVAIMGASGSGKSTCMNVLGCLDTPTRGKYLYRGVDVGGLSRDQRALLRRHYLGFVFQAFNLLARTSALENVEMPLIYRGVGRSERRRLARHALDRVGVGDRADHSPAELSGGQQQRVALARALVTSPHTLLADEPTGNLDSKRSAEILTLLSALNEEQRITILMVTHEAEFAAYAQRVLWFKDGRIVRDGPPDEVLA